MKRERIAPETGSDVLSREAILARLKTGGLIQDVIYYEETDSTNTRAKALAEDGGRDGTLIAADMQTGGKGRRGRSWLQSPGSMISMTLLLRPELPPDKASMLTLLAAHGVVRGIEKMTGLSVSIKWPNDVLAGKRKVCGILTEMRVENGRIAYVVCGIGINANIRRFPEELRDMATSLYLESGRLVDRSALIGAVLEEFETDYGRFLADGDLSGILEDYNRLLAGRNREIKVLDPKGEYKGISRGINKSGELLVEKEDGSVINIYAGEVSVRGLYGYI